MSNFQYSIPDSPFNVPNRLEYQPQPAERCEGRSSVPGVEVGAPWASVHGRIGAGAIIVPIRITARNAGDDRRAIGSVNFSQVGRQDVEFRAVLGHGTTGDDDAF